MGGVKDKGERSGSQRSGGNGASSGGGCVAETGALFPRLHVKEANKSGPRAPPRNKMALYEQFTFPSHRFVPPSAPPPAAERPAVTTSTTTSTYCPQPSSYEGSLFYGSPPTFQGMPWMPYSAMNTRSYHGGQPSVNASSSSTVLDCEGELQQRPSSNASGPWSPWSPSNLYGTNISSKRVRNNDDCTVPSYHKPEASSRVPLFPTKGSDQFTWQGWQHRSADTTPACRPTPISSDHHVESLGPRKLRTTRDDGGKNREVTRKVGNQDQGEEEQSELQESTVVQKEKDPTRRHNSFADSQCRSSQYFKRQHRYKKDSQLDVASDVQGSKSCATVNVESLTVPESGKVCRLQKWKTSHKERRASECSQMSESPLTNTAERDPGKKEKRVGRTAGVQEVNKEANPSECRSSSSAGSGDDVESVSGPDNSEVSQPNEVWSDGAESDAGDTSAAEPECRRRGSIIASTDIVNLIGEQEFWRTRKLLLRQQKVFSTQVFELHRIIKVQQLLASSPVMNEGTVASAGEEGAAMVDLELADMVEMEGTDMVDLGRADMVTLDQADMLDLDEVDHAQEADDVAEDTEAFVGDQETSKAAPVMELDSTGFSSTIDKVCLQPPVLNSQPGQYNTGQVPLMPNVAPGVSSAVWGCPSFAKAGVNNWFGTVPAPNAAYMYPPYAGSFHPRPLHTAGAYNGAYHPVMCTPGTLDAPPLTPYGIPRYEQRPDLMQDMYQYNSYQQQQWQAAMFCPPVSANPVPGWYGVPPPVPYMDPTVRPPYGWYDEMALRSHPPGPYVRPAHQNKAHPMLAPHASGFVPPQSSWPGSSNGQEAVHEGGRFRQHLQWSPSAETGQAARPPTSCGQDFAHPVADSPGPYGPCQASAPTFQRPLPNSAGQDIDVSSSQQHEAEGNGKCGWQSSDGTQERDCGPIEEPITSNHVSADKSLKRSRESRQVVKHAWDKEGSRHTLEGSNLADSQRDARHTLEGSYLAESQRDALPLFPLEPALNGTENGTPRNLPPAVIKAVPRALVATAESAAEILLSIQRQRRQ